MENFFGSSYYLLEISFLELMTFVIPHSDPMRKPRAPARGFFYLGQHEASPSSFLHRLKSDSVLI